VPAVQGGRTAAADPLRVLHRHLYPGGGSALRPGTGRREVPSQTPGSGGPDGDLYGAAGGQTYTAVSLTGVAGRGDGIPPPAQRGPVPQTGKEASGSGGLEPSTAGKGSGHAEGGGVPGKHPGEHPRHDLRQGGKDPEICQVQPGRGKTPGHKPGGVDRQKRLRLFSPRNRRISSPPRTGKSWPAGNCWTSPRSPCRAGVWGKGSSIPRRSPL